MFTLVDFWCLQLKTWLNSSMLWNRFMCNHLLGGLAVKIKNCTISIVICILTLFLTSRVQLLLSNLLNLPLFHQMNILCVFIHDDQNRCGNETFGDWWYPYTELFFAIISFFCSVSSWRVMYRCRLHPKSNFIFCN